MQSCSLCPHVCGAERNESFGSGFCTLPETPFLARAALHTGEEPCFGTAGAVFFAGCTLRCGYCQNYTISRKVSGISVSVERLADIFRELVEQGADVIDLVSPTPFVPSIIAALSKYRPPVPVVYNTSGYERIETLRALDGLVDVYLPDLKYVSSTLSQALSGVEDYPEVALAAIGEMVRQTGKMQLDKRGHALKGTLVRHLVLPGHTKESLLVLDKLADISDIWVSLLFQYTPVIDVPGHPELSRRLTVRECDKVFSHMIKCGLTDGYVQDRESAKAAYIPIFDGTGVERSALL